MAAQALGSYLYGGGCSLFGSKFFSSRFYGWEVMRMYITLEVLILLATFVVMLLDYVQNSRK